jgi:hypothetical protein
MDELKSTLFREILTHATLQDNTDEVSISFSLKQLYNFNLSNSSLIEGFPRDLLALMYGACRSRFLPPYA